MKHQIITILLTVLLGLSCFPVKSEPYTQPTEHDYHVGEKWVWKYKGMTNEGVVRADGTDTREVKVQDGVTGISIGEHFSPLAEITKPEQNPTPRFKWPLEVGKKWLFEEKWTSQDGTEGKTSLNAEVLSLKKETVEAGTFLAFTIQYKGKITNSRGYSADVEELFLYAPEVKNFIKLTQSQPDYDYVEELIEYSKSQAKN